MILDSQEIFAAAQAVTAQGDTASTNVLDTGVVSDDGIGEHLWVVGQVNQAGASGGSATLQMVVQTSVDNASWSDVVSGPAVPVANLTAGAAVARLRLAPGSKRYIRVVWRVGTAALTAGTFSAFATKDLQANMPYGSGFTVA